MYVDLQGVDVSDVVAGNEALNASCSEDGFWRDKEGVALPLAQAI